MSKREGGGGRKPQSFICVLARLWWCGRWMRKPPLTAAASSHSFLHPPSHSFTAAHHQARMIRSTFAMKKVADDGAHTSSINRSETLSMRSDTEQSGDFLGVGHTWNRIISRRNQSGDMWCTHKWKPASEQILGQYEIRQRICSRLCQQEDPGV